MAGSIGSVLERMPGTAASLLELPPGATGSLLELLTGVTGSLLELLTGVTGSANEENSGAGERVDRVWTLGEGGPASEGGSIAAGHAWDPAEAGEREDPEPAEAGRRGDPEPEAVWESVGSPSPGARASIELCAGAENGAGSRGGASGAADAGEPF